MRAVGAKGRQTCAPSRLSGSSTPVMAAGVSVMRPRTRPGRGRPHISSTSMASLRPSQRSEDGPMVSVSRVWRRAPRPRSVMAKRAPGPAVARCMQQWFAGSPRPDQAYQGEKAEPTKAIAERPRAPSSLTPSTYHQA